MIISLYSLLCLFVFPDKRRRCCWC